MVPFKKKEKEEGDGKKGITDESAARSKTKSPTHGGGGGKMWTPIDYTAKEHYVGWSIHVGKMSNQQGRNPSTKTPPQNTSSH